jgi:hypothetical protein
MGRGTAWNGAIDYSVVIARGRLNKFQHQMLLATNCRSMSMEKRFSVRRGLLFDGDVGLFVDNAGCRSGHVWLSATFLSRNN